MFDVRKQTVGTIALIGLCIHSLLIFKLRFQDRFMAVMLFSNLRTILGILSMGPGFKILGSKVGFWLQNLAMKGVSTIYLLFNLL